VAAGKRPLGSKRMTLRQLAKTVQNVFFNNPIEGRFSPAYIYNMYKKAYEQKYK